MFASLNWVLCWWENKWCICTFWKTRIVLYCRLLAFSFHELGFLMEQWVIDALSKNRERETWGMFICLNRVCSWENKWCTYRKNFDKCYTFILWFGCSFTYCSATLLCYFLSCLLVLYNRLLKPRLFVISKQVIQRVMVLLSL